MGSVTYWGNHSKYRVKARRVDSLNPELDVGAGLTYRIPFMPATEMSSYGVHGETFALELDPGIYEFYSWHIYSRGINTFSERPFSVKIRVEPGKAIYVGNFHFHKTSAFLSSVTGAMLHLVDRYQRDMSFIDKKYPNITEVHRPLNLDKEISLGKSSADPVDAVFDMIFHIGIQGASQNAVQ
ncbi:MAG: hypothetical protein MI867_07105 [Pseudomonadales bacterium]|nr:hypothetical protein [Pseudomonadales bacterium]